jgi:predicted Zn-ribbon and HTH transcriptional regulator
MFRLEAHQLIFVYAGIGIVGVLLIAAMHAISRARRERAALLEFFKCGICAFQFRNSTGLVHPRCPNCDALVERKRPSRL